ncbi:MAG: hypothetical protein RI988_909 [Pseudomonadota bacterium]|jgi:flagellar FliL protein
MSTAATDATATEPKKKRSLVKLIVILLVVLILLGAAGVGALLFFKKKQASAADGGEATEAVTDGPKRDPKAVPVFVPLEPFTVNLADRRADRFAQVTISLEVSSGKVADQVRAFMPAVRSAMLLALTTRTAEELLSRDGKARLAYDLQVAALRAMGASTRGLPPPPPVAQPAVAEPAASAASGSPAPARAPAPAAEPPAKAPPADAEPPMIVAVHFANFVIQ